ncbi:C45 family autoproteolytic acyltransferase/hydolase [Ulvibacterium sp.]|uniref:C45 family autoproteolytic acyltransferase/hydolase n=1 Tax=Ulvibacterium sp. TaxID=2665914 RepID=UPI003BA8AB84
MQGQGYIRGIYPVFFLVFLFISCGVSKSLRDLPDISQYEAKTPERVRQSDSTFSSEKGYLTKNSYGLWELYIEGNPLELGLTTGSLTQELFHKQEDALLNKVNELVPSNTKQYLLRKFLAWFNRKMYLNIREEYKTEIYGISQYASETYAHIADAYPRILYLHGAHDIGHALQDLALVGCSSFAVWGDQTEDGQLLIGRNFDFYAGDDFAQEKIIAFINPDEGHKFMSVTWGGMIGVVSGMNDQGLTVTINAGKSKFPLVAKTPISLVTREILQYAATIEEAVAIARKREVFVSESIFVGSAKDKKAVVIEVSPKNFGVYEVQNTDQLICSNHFQSAAYAADKKNQRHILESHSQYRYDRMEELLGESGKTTVQAAVDILRDKQGLDGKEIGYGNEKALNQLLAHHGIVFKPEELLVWVSTNPYQLGEFVAYDLDEVFKKTVSDFQKAPLAEKNLTIPEDPFQHSREYQNYQEYRRLKNEVLTAIFNDQHLEQDLLTELQFSNPKYWEAYYLTGRYQYGKGYYTAALTAFEQALTKEITTVPDKENVMRYIKKIKRRLHL